MVMLFQALDQDGEKFLQLSVKDLRKIVNARKKIDHRKEKKMDFKTMNQMFRTF